MTDEPLHACIVQRRGDVSSAVRTMRLIRCGCHMSTWKSWLPGDPPEYCPVSGTLISPEVAAGDDDVR